MSEVQMIVREVRVAKETTEIFDALASIIADIKAKKSVAEIGANNLTKLFTAVQGFEMLDEEVKHESFPDTAALGGSAIAKALLSKPVVESVTAPAPAPQIEA